MKLMRFFYCFISLLLLVIPTLNAQVHIMTAHPGEIMHQMKEVHGPHVALYNPTLHSRHKLIFMIQGTGGSATGMRSIDSIFAMMGYHVVSIDYKNNVISTICLHSKDSMCADYFRRENITGKSLSAEIDVDSVNSILNRFTTFLLYLDKTDSKGGWNRFIKRGKPQWKNIIVAGHSQGAGHAAYLGKLFKVNRVLIFSGPQDYLEDLKMPAPWLSMKSATPIKRYFAFLNLKDPFHIKYQIANCEKIMNHTYPDTLMIYPGIPIKSHHHILVNNIPTNAPHSSTLFPEFKNVWAYMLGIKFNTNEKTN